MTAGTGGDCNGNQVGETSAQLEVQNVIEGNIPRIMKDKFGNGGYIVYEEVTCIDISGPLNYVHSVSGCSSIDFSDTSDEQYDDSELNCAQCIIEEMIAENIPAGNSLSSVFVDSDLTSEVKWNYVTICYGVPVVVPTQTPGPFPSGTDMLNTTFSGKF